jgi:hypothetical protein
MTAQLAHGAGGANPHGPEEKTLWPLATGYQAMATEETMVTPITRQRQQHGIVCHDKRLATIAIL